MNLLEYRETQVKTINPNNRYETWLFSYEGNRITVFYDQKLGEMQLVSNYYLNENNCPDSINYLEISKLDSSKYFSTETFKYSYDDSSRMKTVIDLHDERIWKTVFIYNEKGQLDSLVKYANKSEGIFGTKNVDTLLYQFHEKYSYDELGRVSKLDKGYAGFWTYEYDDSNQPIKMTSSVYKTRNGCLVEPEQYIDKISLEYNKEGLKSKEVGHTYKINENGKLRQARKWKYIYEYEYYNQ